MRFLLVICLVPSLVLAEEIDSGTITDCRTLSGVFQSIRVVSDNEGCKVYRVYGDKLPQKIAQNADELMVCYEIHDGIVHDLEEDGFACK